MSRVVTDASNVQVIYEDNHLLIINKRIGDIVQGDKTNDPPLSEIIKLYLKKKYDKPGAVFLGVIHRLDRPTSGVVIFSKTSKALARMNQLFLEKKIEKTYWTMVKNNPPKQKDTLTHWLKKNQKTNTTKVYPKEVTGSKKAILHYKVVFKLQNYTLLEIKLETGRSHQIRSQLSYIGCPIKGDLKYGFNRSNPDGGIHLHAKAVKFIHPVSKTQISISATPPKDVLWDECLKKY
ncbi:RNA pseudouridine synthase [Flavobacteriaceae bacterium]|nr:RNA pseudouridine synthase [Flavobacteriaceae bacterium]MDB2631567.1 RNA pseudouridine synthase [Flavobacteriaceae bacterium]